MDDTSTRTRGNVFLPWLIAVGFQSLLSVVALRSPAWFGYSPKVHVFSDVWLYYQDVAPILEGKLPYRDVPVEYPILSLAAFLLPFLVSGTHYDVYKSAFVLEILVVNAALVWLVAKRVEASAGIERVGVRLAWYSGFFAALCPMIVVRFDLWPALLAFAATALMARGQMVSGGVAAGLGVLTKVVPGVVFLPFLAERSEWKPKLRGLLAIGATVGLGLLGWWVLAGERLLAMFRYHGERGIEIESVYGSMYLVAHKLAGVYVINHFDHGSMNLYASGVKDAATLSVIVQGALWLLVAGRAREAGPGHELRLAMASILAYLVAGKVLSPQYLIWLIPFACVLEGPTGSVVRRVFLSCCVLTSLVFPVFFPALTRFEPLAVAVLAARNLSLVVLFAVVLGPRRVTPTRSSPEACS